MDIQCGDRALVHDIRYENIRVETDGVCPARCMQGSRDERYVENPKDDYMPSLLAIVISKNPYSKDSERGNVRDVTYADVVVTGRRAPRSFFNGLDAQLFAGPDTMQEITDDAAFAFVAGDRFGGAGFAVVAVHLHVGLRKILREALKER